MKIELLGEINGNELNQEDLLSYISQIVLTKTDKEISKRHKILEVGKKNLKAMREQLNNSKNVSNKIEKDYAYSVQLSKVISLITALKKEGVIRGALRPRIIRLLNEINKMDFHKLREVEEKFSMYLPDKYNR